MTEKNALNVDQQADHIPKFHSQQDRDLTMPILKGDFFVVTSAQNNTAYNKPVFDRLKLIAEINGGSLVIMPIKYNSVLDQLDRKNPRFHRDLEPFMINESIWLDRIGGVRLSASAILPTAKKPINSADQLNNGEMITIVASPRSQIKTLPRPKNGDHRWVYTSKTITDRNYTDSRIGEEMSNDHHFGGVAIWINPDGTIKHREIVFNDQGELAEDSDLAAVVLGDLHCEKMCHDSLDRALNEFDHAPIIAIHDSLDHMSRNHHNVGSGRFLYQMGKRSVIDDLNDTIRIINKIATKCDQVFMVRSNHDLALDQWLENKQYKPDLDPINAKTFYFLKYLVLETIDQGAESINVFKLAIDHMTDLLPISNKVIYGELDTSFKVSGFDLGSHGHLGISGSRGSPTAYKKFRSPMVTGHTHSPMRDGSHLVVGVTGSLEMGYNVGGSLWDRANVHIYTNETAVLRPYYAIGEAQY